MIEATFVNLLSTHRRPTFGAPHSPFVPPGGSSGLFRAGPLPSRDLTGDTLIPAAPAI